MAVLVTMVNSQFHILSVVDGKALASYQNNGKLGTSPIFWNFVEEKGQYWQQRQPYYGSIFGAICNQWNVCLAVFKNTPVPGTLVIQWEQIQEPGQNWQFFYNTTYGNNYGRFGSYEGYYSYIQNGFGLCLTRTNRQYATVTQEKCNPNSNPNQIFFSAF